MAFDEFLIFVSLTNKTVSFEKFNINVVEYVKFQSGPWNSIGLGVSVPCSC